MKRESGSWVVCTRWAQTPPQYQLQLQLPTELKKKPLCFPPQWPPLPHWASDLMQHREERSFQSEGDVRRAGDDRRVDRLLDDYLGFASCLPVAPKLITRWEGAFEKTWGMFQVWSESTQVDCAHTTRDLFQFAHLFLSLLFFHHVILYLFLLCCLVRNVNNIFFIFIHNLSMCVIPCLFCIICFS